MLKITLLCWMIFCSGIFCSSESSDEEFFPTKTSNSRRRFTSQEDKKLIEIVPKANNDWNKIASYLPGRTQRQCRERWTNYLKPGIKSKINAGSLHDKEIESLYAKYGSKWYLIALRVFGSKEYAAHTQNRWRALQKRQKTKPKSKKRSVSNFAVTFRNPLEDKILQPDRNDEFFDITNVLPEPIFLDPNHSDDRSDQLHVPPVSFGLSNLGNTCFLSAALQMIRNNTNLLLFFNDRADNENLSKEETEILNSLLFIINADLEYLDQNDQMYKKAGKNILKRVKLPLGGQHDPDEFLNYFLNFFPDAPVFGRRLSIVPCDQHGQAFRVEDWNNSWFNAAKYRLIEQQTKIIDVSIDEYTNFEQAFNNTMRITPWINTPNTLIVQQCSGLQPNAFQGLNFPSQLIIFSNPHILSFKKNEDIFAPSDAHLTYQTQNVFILNSVIATQREEGNAGHYIALIYNEDKTTVTIYDDRVTTVITADQLPEWLEKNNFQQYIGCYAKTEETDVNVGIPVSAFMNE